MHTKSCPAEARPTGADCLLHAIMNRTSAGLLPDGAVQMGTGQVGILMTGTVDVSGNSENRPGNLNRVMAARSSTGIFDSHFEADGRLGLVHSTGRWDPQEGYYWRRDADARCLGRRPVPSQCREARDREWLERM